MHQRDRHIAGRSVDRGHFHKCDLVLLLGQLAVPLS